MTRAGGVGVVFAVIAALITGSTGTAAAGDDEIFATLETRDDGHTYELFYRNGTGRQARRPLATQVLGRPAFSPDGQRLAFTAPITDGTDGRWGIFRARADGSNVIRLTAPSGADLDPAWSADGRWIAYSRDSQGTLRPSNCCVIRVMRANGKKKSKVPGTEGGINPSWSPNGKRIVYEKNGGLWVTNLTGSNTFQLAVNGREPAWSPDGSKIAYVRTRGADHELVVIPSGGGSPNVRATSSARLESPSWDGDGTSLYYLRYTGVGYDGRRSATVWWDRAGDAPAPLFSAARPMVLLAQTGTRDVGCDVDGDRNGDLVVGAPRDDEPGQPDAGVVHVITGSAAEGLTAAGDQLWHQANGAVAGTPGPADRFGKAVACGDFDGDGYGDVAIGAPGDLQGAGAVNVLYGSPNGLTADDDQIFHQDIPGIPGTPGFGDEFGAALASGDFDGDGHDDLAVGAPGDLQGGGVVNVIYGSAAGLQAVGTDLWHQGVTGVKGDPQGGDGFGTALAAADFDGDGRDDLAIGVPGDAGTRGAVAVLYGRASGLDAAGDQLWQRDDAALKGGAAVGERFGEAVAAGDVDGDGFADLAVGAPGHASEAGLVAVIYGSSGRLTGAGDQVWTQDSPGVQGTAEPGDDFGKSVAIGDFDGDGRGDVAIGIPGEDLNAGRVTILPGAPDGATAEGSQRFLQGTDGVRGTAQRGDRFGRTLAVGDFDGNRRFDLAIGAPGENHGGVTNAGATNVLYGSDGGLTAAGDQIWRQDTPGIRGTAGENDRFGAV